MNFDNAEWTSTNVRHYCKDTSNYTLLKISFFSEFQCSIAMA